MGQRGCLVGEPDHQPAAGARQARGRGLLLRGGRPRDGRLRDWRGGPGHACHRHRAGGLRGSGAVCACRLLALRTCAEGGCGRAEAL
eukprot:7171213-Lingulodinium_polyedra.AAC.1